MQIVTNVADFQKGLLTVKLIQAKALSAPGGLLATTNPYVEMVLVDCDKLRCDERKRSRVVYNDQSPRWNDKFDFVMVSAGEETKDWRALQEGGSQEGGGRGWEGVWGGRMSRRGTQRTGPANPNPPPPSNPPSNPNQPQPPPQPKGSMLTVNVWDKTTAVEMATSLKVSRARFQDRLIGRVTVPVADVVRNGRLKDAFALQDAESGTIEMKLEWANCYVDDYVD